MGSKGRIPPPHLRHPLPSPNVVHPDPYASAIRPPLGGFPPFEMLPPHEVMEQKLSAQHHEIEKLAVENRRLATTHGTLRQDLATAKHELQLIHAHIAHMKSEKEQQTRGLMEKMSMMEPEIEAGKNIKTELQQARTEAQSLVATRQELISKAQQLTRDLQMAHADAQQIPALMAELDSLRQEYQHCRATYDYEKKLYNDHLESLQVMEKNYMAMSREVEKLRAELSNSANNNPGTAMTNAGGPYGGSVGYNEGAPVAHNYPSGQNAYGVGQVQGPQSGNAAVNSPNVVAQSAPRGPAYNVPHRGQVAPGYNPPRGPTPAYDANRGQLQIPPAAAAAAAYDMAMQRGGLGGEAQRAANYDPQKGQISANNLPYAAAAASSIPNIRPVTGYDPSRNPARR